MEQWSYHSMFFNAFDYDIFIFNDTIILNSILIGQYCTEGKFIYECAKTQNQF